MDYYANVDGVLWFSKEIFPKIKEEVPDAEFYIVGSNPTEAVKALSNNDGIRVTGYVPDTREYLKKGTVAVVPLRIARGIQNKILEAMAMGLPVVTTSQALEGICAEEQRDVIVEDEPVAFSRAVVKMLRTPSLRVELKTNARKCIEENYSWVRNLSKLDELMQ
jgi:polysaccharide biosynthesis protein PslH